MSDRDSLCERLPGLLQKAAAVGANGLGVLRTEGTDRVVLTYASPHGVSAHRVSTSSLPSAFQPPWTSERRVTAAQLSERPAGILESRLLWTGMPDEIRREYAAKQVIAIPLPGERPALMMTGVGHDTALDAAHVAAVAALADDLVTEPPEPMTAELAWLRRLASADVLLPALFQVLDIRDIFDTVSRVTQELMPHDMLALGVFNADASEVAIYAHTSASRLPQVVPNRYPLLLAQGWLYHFYNDVSTHPIERHMDPAKAGARSSLNVAIRAGDRLLGGLSFFSSTPSRYTTSDIAVAQRIADYVGLALSHYHIAEEARRAEALKERTANLEMLDGLLRALSGALDIREVFDLVSEAARKTIPHDALGLPFFVGDEVIPFGSRELPTGSVPPRFPMAAHMRYLLTEPWEYEIYGDLQNDRDPRAWEYPNWGFASALRIAVRVKDRLAGMLVFLSKAPHAYTHDHVVLARRIADHVALALSHQEMAEEAKRVETLRERAANLELLDGLLRALSETLDLREAFERVSKVAHEVIPHDGLAVPILIDDDHVLPFATLGLPTEKIPSVLRLPDYGRYLLTDPWEYEIFDDLIEKPDPRSGPYAAWGFRSALRVPVKVANRIAGLLIFFSKSAHTYHHDHVIIARRIADHISLTLSHQRLADEARKNQELQARASALTMLDELLDVVTGGGELPAVWDRVSDVAQKVLPHDALVLTAVLPGGLKARVYASRTRTPNGFAEIVDVPPHMLANPDWEYELVDDLATRPEQKHLEAVKRGYRGALRVAIRLQGEYVAGVSFLSFTPGTYTDNDVPIARRIAERLSFSFARERATATAQRADEATERAKRLESRVRALTDELDARTGYRRVIGESKHWRNVLKQATQVAATETTALLLGESGTGKEVIARFVHRASPRSHGPFVALNCAALPEQLLEAELFGYERGAFTGAMQTKPGQIEQAAGGTLFLDEVGEMSPTVQAKFLRVLQEREFQRLGGTRVMRADVRIVAATNRDLLRAMEKGTFREDLYYRLNVFAIMLPALRDRRDDVLPLSDAFLAEYGKSLGRPPAGISRDAKERLLSYNWPGNVRELRNILERAAILCDGGLITSEHLALNLRPISAPPGYSSSSRDVDSRDRRPSAREPALPDPPPPGPREPGDDEDDTAAGAREEALETPGHLQDVERAMIEKALKTVKFNKSKAAKQLGLSRAQLYVRLKKYGLE